MDGNYQFTEEERAEAFRQEHARHLARQTKAIETIKTYVAVWFWCSVAAAVLYVVASMSAASSSLGY